MATQQDVIEIAKKCFDPEIPVNIWDLGLVYEIKLDDAGESAEIQMSLTSQACPSAQQIPTEFKKKLIDELKLKSVNIQVVYDPPWTPDRMTEAARDQLGIF